jgi:HK97 family phage portal protein
MSPEAEANLRESFERVHAGLDGAHRVAILEDGVGFKTLSVPPEDAQFLETRKYTVTDIARAFGVPPSMIGDLERATYSNVEQQSMNFVQHSLRPLLVRFEQEFNRKLFTRGRGFFCEHSLDALLRGDLATRYGAYSTGLAGGFLSVNDVRRYENLNPLGPEGDAHLVGVNMQTLEQASKGRPEPDPKPFGGDDDNEDGNDDGDPGAD